MKLRTADARIADNEAPRKHGPSTASGFASCASHASVAILLCTKDGGTFLHEQLDSIAQQTHGNWKLVASDDGSTDRTLEILGDFQARYPERVDIRHGPRRGFCANFLSLATDSLIDADYFAYCDQDDIWHCEKLARALGWLETVDKLVPALYCSRARVIDLAGIEIGLTRHIRQPAGFKNALVENIASGNTMVFNDAARKLLVRSGAANVFFHDWWTYQLVTACGGLVHCDAMPSVMYRQHAHNIIGPNLGILGIVRRASILFDGRFQKWIEANVRALEGAAGLMVPANQVSFRQFCAARQAGFLARLVGFRRSGVYRQTEIDNLVLMLMAMIGKA